MDNLKPLTKRQIDNLVNYADWSEKSIEKYLVEECKKIGLLCLKYTNPNQVGYPDRLIIMPEGRVIWVELKSKGKKPSQVQEYRHEELRSIGHVVKVISSKETVDDLLYMIREWSRAHTNTKFHRLVQKGLI